MDRIVDHDSYFQQKTNAANKCGISPHIKITAALRQLAYSASADSLDEYFQISATTANDSLKRFCSAVIDVFGDEYLRAPTESDIERLLDEGEKRGFPGMLGSLDCMHWEWQNCPKAWHGQYIGKEKVATVVLEAVASKDGWIWHAYFGLPGSLNDINVLQRSPLFDELIHGYTAPVKFTVNGHEYNMGYYLADGIYPKWATLIQSVTDPKSPKLKVRKKHSFIYILE